MEWVVGSKNKKQVEEGRTRRGGSRTKWRRGQEWEKRGRGASPWWGVGDGGKYMARGAEGEGLAIAREAVQPDLRIQMRYKWWVSPCVPKG